MRRRITQVRIAVMTGIVLSLVAISTAGAVHVFEDVPDDKFFAGPVEWAAANGITVGTSPTTFEPYRSLTRGEGVTFLKRYDDNIVQPALGDRYTQAEVDAAIADAIAALDTYTQAEVDVAIADAIAAAVPGSCHTHHPGRNQQCEDQDPD